MSDDLISTKETMSILGVTRRWVIDLINEGKLEGRKIGNQFIVSRKSVMKYRKEVQKKD